MKFCLSLLWVLFSSCILKAQCPVIEGAMVKICGVNEGINEFVLFSTTATATAGDYTLYYGDNSTPALGLPVSILAGANATTPSGTGTITSTNGCIINQVTTAATIIPANSKVLFIPAGFDANYDVSAICSLGNIFIVYVDITSLPSLWNVNGVLVNTPTVTSYLQVTNGAALCTSAVRDYNNNWASNIDGNSVWWDGVGNATYLNNGCSVIGFPVTISNFTSSPVCAGTTANTASYTITGSPDTYTLLWDAAASSAGFVDVINASLPNSPLTLTVPAGAAATTYTGSIIVKNTLSGISSIAQNISVIINPQIASLFTAISPICSNTIAPVLPTTSTNSISGTWSPAIVSNTLSGNYTFTPSAGFCAIGTSLSITILPLPTATISGTTTICSNTSSNITFNGTPNAIVSYNINGGANLTVTLDAAGTITIATGNLTINATYNLVSVATNGIPVCAQPATGSAIVSIKALPTATISGTTTICSNTSSNITFNGTPNAIVTYNINGGANQTATLDAAGTTIITTGNLINNTTYNLVSIATNGTPVCSQPATGSAIVTIKALPTATISGTTTICSGTSSNIIFNGTPNAIVTYNINGGANLTATLDATGATTITTGNLISNTTYNLVSVATNGTPVCSQPATGSAIVSIKALPTATFSGTTTICSGTSSNIILNGTPNATVTYNINGGANQTSILDAAGTTTITTGNLTNNTTYNLISVASNGTPVCSQPAIGSAIVTIKALPTATISGTTTICSGTSSNIIFNGTPNATVTYNINGGANQTATLNTAGTTSIATGNLINNTTYNLVSVASTGTPVCSQPATGSVIVSIKALPTASISGTTTICSGTSSNIILNGTPNATVTYNINGGANQTATLDAAGIITIATGNLVINTTYNLVSVASNGTPVCSQPATGSAIVSIKALPTATISGTTTICFGTSSNIIFNGTPNAIVTYNINGGTNQTAILDAAGTITIATGNLTINTTYNLVSVITNGTPVCFKPATGSAIVSIKALPTDAISGSVSICNGTATTIIFNGTPYATVFYNADGGAIQNSQLDATGTASLNTGNLFTTTQYNLLSVTSAGIPACSQNITGQAIVTVKPITPIAIVTNSVSLCQNEIATPLTATGTDLLWYTVASGGVGTVTAPTPVTTNDTTIDYYVTQTIDLCESQPVAITVTVNPTPDVPTFPPSAIYRCGPGMVTLKATAPGLISWYADSALTQFLSSTTYYDVAITGTTVFYVTNTENNCVSPVREFTAIVFPLVKQIAGFSYNPATVCIGSAKPVPVPVTGFVLGGLYSSTAGLSLNSITGVINPALSTPGTYTIKYVLGAALCAPATSSTTTITITKSTVPVITFSYASPICSSGTNPLPVLTTGFIIGGSFSSTAGLSINATTGVINLKTSTAGTYTVTYNLAVTACVTASISQADITIITPPPATFTNVIERCGNGVVNLNATATGTVKWYSDAALTNLLSQGNSYSPSLNTTTTFYVTNTVGNCISPVANATATVVPMIVQVKDFSYNPSTVCTSSKNPVPIPAVGFVQGGVYSSDAGLSINSGTGVINLLTSTPGTYVVKYILSAPVCAFAGNNTATIIINKPATTITTFSYASPVCISGSNPLPVKAAGFNNDGIFSSTAGLFINATTGIIDLAKSIASTYTVTYTVTATPCETGGSSKATITINNFIAAPFAKGNQRCGSGTLTLNATGVGTLNWYSQPNLKTIIATGTTYSPTVNSTTDFYVTTASGNCESEATVVTATVLPNPIKPSLGKYTSICAGDKFVLQPGIYDQYQWQDNSTAPSFTVTSAGQYSLLVKSANGCSITASILITPSTICADILFPSAFSPNGDQLNDNFGPLPLRNLGYVKNYTLRIFNRYGQVVFQTADPNKRWDGTYLGQLFDTGSFMWQSTYIYDSGSSKSQKGSVTIVR